MKQKEHAEGEGIIFSLVYKSGEMKFLNFWSLASISEHFFFKHSLGRRRRANLNHPNSPPYPYPNEFLMSVRMEGAHAAFSVVVAVNARRCCAVRTICYPRPYLRTTRTSFRSSGAFKALVLVLGWKECSKERKFSTKALKLPSDFSSAASGFEYGSLAWIHGWREQPFSFSFGQK